ncbi:DUF1905 domain-containing protein [Pigmentibacter sp. JX0631]|uniref:DUF1905 domain-containing protein n=1 Tax=Pigmentibacter sp. JX0631 TaxID=2976982 RepID=UPI0024684AA7|nr:DUF1905 domain-containing protein [Pigmentibacter sp. JX0631]WGL59796.1 DUF1905 domain-containing protein [Pigmentibacter sp. JX0631]
MVIINKKMSSKKVLQYSFESKLWKYKGEKGWYFLTLSKELSRLIKKNHFSSEEGWGRLRVTCNMGRSVWSTAIWYDSKFEAYLLPIKIAVRKKEGVEEGDILKCSLKI